MDSPNQKIELSPVNPDQNESDPLTEIDKVLTEPHKEITSSEQPVDILEPEVSKKALTRAELIKKVRNLYKLSGNAPIIEGKACKNFARLRKNQLLLCLKFYASQIDPTSNVTSFDPVDSQQSENIPCSAADPMHSDFVSSVLYRANLMLLSGLENLSQTERFQQYAGFCFKGMVEHIESQTSTQIALRECLFEIYSEHKELLDSFISPTSKLVLINMQIAFACARRKQLRTESFVRNEQKCKDKAPCAPLAV